MQDYQSTITVKLPAEQALNRISKITDWWGVTMEGNPSKLNDNFVIRMTGDSFFNMRVSELIPDKKMSWHISDCNMPWYNNKKEWTDTSLIFECVPESDGTRITFTHEGLTPQSECWEDCKPGWTHWIQTSLYSYLTTGQGVFRKPTK
jgi:hypothetical protein